MSLYAKFMRRWFPKTYAKQGLQQAEQSHGRQLKAALPEERANLKSRLSWELWEWIEWVREIEDAELVAKAAKMEIHLDDMQNTYYEDEERRSH